MEKGIGGMPQSAKKLSATHVARNGYRARQVNANLQRRAEEAWTKMCTRPAGPMGQFAEKV